MCSKYWIQHKRTIYVSYAYDSNGFSVKILSLCHFILLNAFQLSKNLLNRSWWQMDSVELFIFINLNSDINAIIIIRTANFKQWINFFFSTKFIWRGRKFVSIYGCYRLYERWYRFISIHDAQMMRKTAVINLLCSKHP